MAVDHRYGSHLRKYHAEWKKRPTRDNFFYWLDYSEGKDVSLENCSREKLDSMKIRYLGREERVNYAVEVDRQGKLCWKRNGARINTTEEWRDSIKGIVRVDDPAPNPNQGLGFYVSSSESSGPSSAADDGESDESDESTTTAKKKKQQPKAAATALVETGFKEFANDAKAKILDHRPFKHPAKEPGEKKKKKKKCMWIFVRCLSIFLMPHLLHARTFVFFLTPGVTYIYRSPTQPITSTLASSNPAHSNIRPSFTAAASPPPASSKSKMAN